MTAATDNAPWRPVDSLANRLRLVRAEKGLSQKEAAFACGISPRVWQNAEDGRSIRDEVQVLASIAKHLDVDREWLFWGGALNSENPHPDGPDGGNDGLGIKSPKLYQLSYRGTHDDSNAPHSELETVA